MVRSRLALPALMTAAAVAGATIVIATGGGDSTASQQPAAAPAVSYGPPPLAQYEEAAPHVLSQLNVYGVQGGVAGAGSAPPSELPPVSPAAFKAPVAAYLAFASKQLGLMEGQVAQLQAALAAGDRASAQAAWRGAFDRYLELGAVYLEGQIAQLNQAIDGTAGGLSGGISSPQFTGLHRLELGLWTGAPLASLEPYASRLALDVSRLRAILPTVQISPLDYATRAHEILEDAVRDLLSGTDVPWSGEGVLGTAAGLAATREVIATLTPVLGTREGVLPVVDTELDALGATLASIQAAHGRVLPTNAQLTQEQAEQLDSAVGAALEALAQVPGALETTRTAQIPQIPPSAIRIDQ